MCCLTDNAIAQAPADASELTIAEIKVVGNRSITTLEVLAKLQSRVGQLFDADTANEDTKRIVELSGVDYSYYNSKIVNNKIELTFSTSV